MVGVGPSPLALVQGRERMYVELFWSDCAAWVRVSPAGRLLGATPRLHPGITQEVAPKKHPLERP